MSHITNVKLQVNDLDAVEAALEALGGALELRRDQTQYQTYYGGKACAHAIGFKDNSRASYEIGLVAGGDGFQTIVDTWGPGAQLTAICGQNLNRLRQEYAVAVTERRAAKTLARKGFHATRENLANGTVRLVLRKR